MRHIAIKNVQEHISLILFYCFNYEPIVSRKEKEGSTAAFTLACLEDCIFVAEYIQRPNNLPARQPIHLHQLPKLRVRITLNHAVKGYLLLLVQFSTVITRRFCALPVRGGHVIVVACANRITTQYGITLVLTGAAGAHVLGPILIDFKCLAQGLLL